MENIKFEDPRTGVSLTGKQTLLFCARHGFTIPHDVVGRILYTDVVNGFTDDVTENFSLYDLLEDAESYLKAIESMGYADIVNEFVTIDRDARATKEEATDPITRGLVFYSLLPQKYLYDDAINDLCGYSLDSIIWTEENLDKFCQTNLEWIAAGKLVSEITVRYAESEGKFGYAHFGEFFFFGDCMYHLSNDERYVEDHNPDVMEFVFDEFIKSGDFAWKYCHRVFFAGVDTGFCDNRGDEIFTGDIIRANGVRGGVVPMPFLSTPAEPIYAVLLDNHCLPLNDAHKPVRVGTIFFQLDFSETSVNIRSCCASLVNMGAPSDEELLPMATHTPSFYQEIEKYKALETLGIEYEWRRES